jgi:hypothetical protein
MRTIGIFTEDFHFFYELVRRLKEKGEPFVSISLTGEVPPGVGVVITTEAEREKLHFSNVVTEKDPDRAIDVAKCMLVGGTKYHTLVIGIDPGKNTGLAIFGEGKLLVTETVRSTGKVAEVLEHFLHCLDYHKAVARIGHGDPTNRNRIMRSIWGLVDEIEQVDETGTTQRTLAPDIDAAKRIAMAKGQRIEEAPEVAPTAGELRDIQRLSRIESEGSVTISSELANAVAKGDMTLRQAVLSQRKLSSEDE